ncbi:MAG: hypothetical protein K2X93_15705 [Candidatus Obscuribacterales bacterium]|nr:hypothetical protein [Candidatus Obscuribacterales bacterium]
MGRPPRKTAVGLAGYGSNDPRKQLSTMEFEWNNCDDFDLDAVFQSFFEGVDSHKDGSKIWNECLDEINLRFLRS